MDLLNLTLTTQPFKTLQFFIFATLQYLRRSLVYILAKGGWILVLSLPVFAVGLLLFSVDGPHEKVITSSLFIFSYSLYINVTLYSNNLLLDAFLL